MVTLTDEQVVEGCEKAAQGDVVSAVNFNTSGQVVIAGSLPAIEKATELAKEAGARRAMMLPVSVPAHSSLMRPAGDALAETLASAGFSDSDVPVICAVDGTPYAGAEDIRERMTVQVYSPVRWVATVQHMIGQGVTTVVECGPGKVLAGLVKRIDRGTAASCIDSPETLDNIRSGIGT